MQPATEPFTVIFTEVAVPPMTSGGEFDTVAMTVLHVIEWFATSIFCAHAAIGTSNAMAINRSPVLMAPPFQLVRLMSGSVVAIPGSAQSGEVSSGTTGHDWSAAA